MMRPDLFAIAPDRIKRLPVDPVRGYPVPWFVPWVEPEGGGPPVPEFRAADPRKGPRAVRERLCWVCGEVLGVYQSFVIGPMCSINRVSAEPPSHPDCAEFSVRACPFLARPHMERRRGDASDRMHQGELPAGFMIERNPGVSLVWTVRSRRKGDGFQVERLDGGQLFHLTAEPERVEWWAEGRPATRAEVVASIESGLPLLVRLAEADGPVGVQALGVKAAHAVRYLPAEVKGGVA